MNGALQLAGKSALYSGCGKVSMISLDRGFRADISARKPLSREIIDTLPQPLYKALLPANWRAPFIPTLPPIIA
ncbi:hypothetical protein IDZ78_09605, partial [Francisella tularensis subsp. holarctica]|nr:hypothetical protein [Francisella tularensis subsp. holarctica]